MGLTSLRFRARRFSAPLLLAYGAVLLLMAFGHRHGPTLAATWDRTPQPHGKSLAGAAKAGPSAEHNCLVCALERGTTAVATVDATPRLTLSRRTFDSVPAASSPRPGDFPFPPSRGPPSC